MCYPFDVLRTRLIGQGEPKVHNVPMYIELVSSECVGSNVCI